MVLAALLMPSAIGCGTYDENDDMMPTMQQRREIEKAEWEKFNGDDQ